MSANHVNVFLTSELFYPDLPGGVLRWFRYGPGLADRGIRLHAVTLHHKPGLVDEETVNGIHIHRLHAPPSFGCNPERLRPWLLGQALSLAVEELRRGGRSILQPNILSHRIVPALLKARLRGIPAVFNATIAPEVDEHRSIPRRILRSARTAVMCAPVNRFLFLSHELQRLYSRRWWLRSSQRTVIPNGVDLDRFRPCRDAEERSTVREHFGFRPCDKVVLFVGGVMQRKGIDILLEAWNSVTDAVPDAVLAVAGTHGPRASHDREGYRERLDDFLRRLDTLREGLRKPESVRFLGEVADPAPCFRAADLFAFPSRREGMPNAVLEAMASSLPCLVARFDGMPRDGEELGNPGEHYIPLGHDPGEWSERIVETCSSIPGDGSASIGRKARSWVERHQDLDEIIERWARLYLDLA